MITGLRIHDNDRVQIADAPSDFSTGEFLTEILPSLRPGADARDWELKDGADGRVLSPELSLEENQVRSRDALYLVPKAGSNGLAKPTCSRCGAQNLAGARFCSTCGRELAGQQSRGPLPPIEITRDKDPDEDLAFDVESPAGGTRHCEAPADTLTGDLVRDLVDAFRLPKMGADGRAVEYRLHNKASGETLDGKKRLSENGVESGGLYLLARKTSLLDEIHAVVHPGKEPIEPKREEAEPRDLRFKVFTSDGRSQHCEAPADTITGALVRDLVDGFRLPKLDAKGNAITYVLLRRGSEEALDEKKTLAGNGVERGGEYALERKTSLFGHIAQRREPEPMAAPAEDLRFEVVTGDGRQRHCEAPADTSTREFVNDVIDRFALPKAGPSNQRIAYVLVDERTGVPLDEAKTLAQNRVVSGHRLLIRGEAPSVAVVEGWFARHGKMAALIALGVLVSAGLLWAVLRPGTAKTVKKGGIAKEAQTPRVDVEPGRYEVAAGGTVQFTARVANIDGQTVHWAINPAVGAISAGGLYTAPATVAAAQDVKVEATSDESPSTNGQATVTLLPSPPPTPPSADGTDNGNGATVPGADATATLRITPAAANVNGGDTVRFTAGGAAVQWSVNPAVGTISQRGVYTAPALVTQPQRVRVIASGDSQATAIVNLQPVTVSGVTASGDSNGTLRFGAAVGHTRNTGVTWSVQPQSGVISQDGVYTRDPRQRDAMDLTVTATSAADPSKSASTVVHLAGARVNPPPSNVKISLNPFEHVLLANQTVVFSATVTGSADKTFTWATSGVGTIYGNGLFVVPKGTPPGDHLVHIVATSHADPSKKAEGDFVLRVPPPYAGARQGVLVWTGNLDRNALLTIEGTRASNGSLMGELPGVAVALRIDTQKCALVKSPGPDNGWRSVQVRTLSKVRSLSIGWSVVQ